jgi:hypothetical protein
VGPIEASMMYIAAPPLSFLSTLSSSSVSLFLGEISRFAPDVLIYILLLLLAAL